jgi:acetyl esterase/lipase
VSCALRDLPYGEGFRHLGDLHLPLRRPPGPPAAPVLLIHGGGWDALSKESLDPVARLVARGGRPVFNINYSLLGHPPWPACRDDCVAAARFMLAGGLAPHGLLAPHHGHILVVGASAGGHLAMLTGLALGAHACAGIVSLAGPSRLVPGPADTEASAIRAPGFLQKFFNIAGEPSHADLRAASPSAQVTSKAPPLHALHSRNDRLVPPAHSEEAVAAWRAVGVPARLDFFDGRGDLHGFWTSDDLETRALDAQVEHLLQLRLNELP